ncbi:hypothetical protein [Gordonia oryzae]|nr:hypothetical protein [Gordonia oryzae]
MATTHRIDLDDVERDFLLTGLLQWGGVVAMTDDLAKATGFSGAEDYYSRVVDLVNALDDPGLSATDWRRALAVAEVAFSSEILGLGHQWEDFSHYDPDDTYQAMRRLQWRVLGLSY